MMCFSWVREAKIGQSFAENKGMFKLIIVFLYSAWALSGVFPDVAHQRRELEGDEKFRLLKLGHCSASALTPNIIITAEHCIDNKNGYMEADPTQTFSVVKILEKSSHYENDILIAEIKWKAKHAPKDLIVTKKIIISKDEVRAGEDHEATKLYVLGYPMDRNKEATFSWGYLKGDKFYRGTPVLKTKDAVYITFNAPTTHGNSGGPVYTEDYALIGIVSAGDGAPTPAEMESVEYNSQNPKYFNLAGALYFYYPRSKLLQKLFPKVGVL